MYQGEDREKRPEKNGVGFSGSPLLKEEAAGFESFKNKSITLLRRGKSLKAPNAEFLQDHSFMVIGMCTTEMSSEEIDFIIFAFKKVWANLSKLR
jgi:hypothetical protein